MFKIENKPISKKGEMLLFQKYKTTISAFDGK